MLARIKQELGPDAVILGTRNLSDNGSSIYEVTAALEDSTRQQAPAAPATSGGGAKETAPGPEAQSGAPMPEGPQDYAGWRQWHQEWSQIKEHLTALMRPQMDFRQLTPIQRQALEYLEKEGVSGDVVLRLYRELQNDSSTSVLGPLERMVQAEPWGPGKWSQQFHAVAGPYGVGKTSALVRMALSLKRENPGLRILLVNADQHRVNSRLLLKHYAELAEMTYKEAKDRGEFEEIVATAHGYDKVFIDLPGLDKNMTLERLTGQLGLDAASDMQIHLVFSPHFAPNQLRSFEQQYYSPLAASIIWSKLDEATHFGALVNTAAATGLPVSSLSFGAGLTDSMAPARHVTMWRLVFKHKLPSEE